MKKVSFFSALLLTACVTINIYFPAAAAEKVADEIIKGIQAEDEVQIEGINKQTRVPAANNEVELLVYRWIDNSLNIFIKPANAAANLSVDSAEIRQLQGTMRSRFASLKNFYSAGLIGIKSDGLIMSRGSVPLKDKNKLNKLIAGENSDRQRLYQAIANANGHPEWTAQIKSTFAKRWVSNAQSGWWYQKSNGSWNQK